MKKKHVPVTAMSPDDESYFQQMLDDLKTAEEVERIFVPWVMPRHNKAQNWHPMARAKNVRLIHEAILLSVEHMFDKEDVPNEWEWHEESGECPLVNPMIKRDWFNTRWAKDVLKLKRIPKKGTGTIIELQRLSNNKTHVHVHSILQRLGDEDGVYTKHLLDALTLAQFFPDDREEYVSGLTQTQSKL